MSTSLPAKWSHSGSSTQLKYNLTSSAVGCEWDYFKSVIYRDFKPEHEELIKQQQFFKAKHGFIKKAAESTACVSTDWQRRGIQWRKGEDAKRKGGNGSGDMSHALLFVLHEAGGKLQSPNTQEADQRATSHLLLTAAQQLPAPHLPASVASHCKKREHAAVTKSIIMMLNLLTGPKKDQERFQHDLTFT